MSKSKVASSVFVAVLVAAWLIAPIRTAGAAELVPAISSEVGWDSNNDGRTSGEKGNVRARTTPEITVRDSLGRLAFDGKLRVAYDNALDADGLDDYLDQFADLGVVWSITSRTELSLRNGFARVQNIDRAVAIDTFALEEIPDNEDERSRSIRNRSNVTLTHRFTSRWSGSLSGNHSLRSYKSESRFDRDGFGGAASLQYILNARTTIGFGGRASYDSYERTPLRRGSRARYYQAFATLSYLIAPDLQMSMSAGPAWVDRRTNPGSLDFRTYPFVTSFGAISPFTLDPTLDRSQPWGFLVDPSSPNCLQVDGVTAVQGCAAVLFPVLMTTQSNPVNPDQNRVAGSSNDTEGLDVFASFSVTKSWEWGDVGLAYNRRESDGGGQGDSSVADSITLNASGYKPAPLWTLGGLFNWSQRESSGRVPLDLAALQAGFVSVDIDENGIINGPGTIVATLPSVGESIGYVTAGSTSGANDVTSYLIQLRADRKLSENLNTYGTWSWRRDDSEGSLQSDTTRDVFRIFVGLRYTFDPIPF